MVEETEESDVGDMLFSFGHMLSFGETLLSLEDAKAAEKIEELDVGDILLPFGDMLLPFGEMLLPLEDAKVTVAEEIEESDVEDMELPFGDMLLPFEDMLLSCGDMLNEFFPSPFAFSFNVKKYPLVSVAAPQSASAFFNSSLLSESSLAEFV